MDGHTVVKPRPGARQFAVAGGDDPAAADDHTVFASTKSHASRERLRLPTTRLDPVCDDASKLLSLAVRLGQIDPIEDMAALKRQCMELVREYQQALKARGLSSATVDMASYCVCALIDELVLNSEWELSGQWAASSLLSEFHSQTWAGTHFYDLLDAARQSSNTAVLTLQYLCLSLGFKGRYRLEEQGQEQLDILRDGLYQQIFPNKGRIEMLFDRQWKMKVVPGNALAQTLPLWVCAAICCVVLLLSYLGFVHSIDALARPVVMEFAGVGTPVQPEDAQVSDKSVSAHYLQRMLQTEIDRGLLELQIDGDRARLRMGSEALFASGSAEVREEIIPFLAKISRVLETAEGSILVIGHSDDRPITTSQYPSNWHLSLARATAVADLLAVNADLSGRLWPEGKGETEPRFTNDTTTNRARNRRVEILWFLES